MFVGRKYDKYGNMKEWWTNTTLQTFEEKIECFVKQYNNFTIEGVPSHVSIAISFCNFFIAVILGSRWKNFR